MSAARPRRLRPEDLADLDEAVRRVETGGTSGERDVHRRLRQEAGASYGGFAAGLSRALPEILTLAGLDALGRPGERLRRAYGRMRALLFAGGGLLGALPVAGGLMLAYAGGRPANVLFILAFVGLQILMLLLLALGLILGNRLETIVPFVGVVRSAVSSRWHALAERQSGSVVDAKDGGEADPARESRCAEESLYAGIDRWRTVALLQWLAIGFGLGMVGALLVRLAFTDVIFGWSTSLGVMAAAFPSIAAGIAWPWAGWLPSAVPDPGVVEATRYVRVGGDVVWTGGALEADVLLFSGWWPFLVMAILFYGVLPRVAVLGLCAAMIQRHLRWAVRESSRLGGLRRRMATPLVEREPVPSADGPAADDPDEDEVEGRSSSVQENADALGPSTLVLWGGGPDPGARLDRAVAARTGASLVARVEAGGLDHRATESAVSGLCAGRPGRLPVVIVAEAFEPPVGGLLDAVRTLRAGGVAGRPVVVALVDELEEGGWVPVRPENLAMWRRGLSPIRHQDPHLLGPVTLPAPDAAS